MASNLHFLTQFIRSQGLLLINAISWILLLKKVFLVFLTKHLKSFQSTDNLEEQYIFNLLLYSLFYHVLDHLVILILLGYLNQKESTMVAYS